MGVIGALLAYNVGVVAALTERQQILAEVRDAARLGITLDAWRMIRGRTLGVELLREIHVAATGRPANVRRANEDGTWTIVSPKPGRLRSRPQAFRIGDHIERAWDHATLRKRLAELLRAEASMAQRSPFDAAGQVVWSLLRAQPFLGLNEKTALLVAACLLNTSKFPTLPVAALEHDKGLAAASLAQDAASVRAVLERAVWQEALEFAEWLPLPAQTSRRSLEDEQRELAAARERVVSVEAATIDGVTQYVVQRLPAHFQFAGECEVSRPTSHPERLAIAVASARCGRYISPRLPITRLRWQTTTSSISVQVVIGAAGRGLTGASSLHLTIIVGEVSGRSSPTMLLVPNEDLSSCRRRIDEWLVRAIPMAFESCPMIMPGSWVAEPTTSTSR